MAKGGKILNGRGEVRLGKGREDGEEGMGRTDGERKED